MTNLVKAQSQHNRAKTGDAKNQCNYCGVYRTDGGLPYLHRDNCPNTLTIEESVKRYLRELK